MILVNLLPPDLRRKEPPKITMPEIPVKKTLLVLACGVLALQLLMSVVAVYYSTRYSIVRHESGSLSAKLEGVRRDAKQTSVVAKKMQDLRSLKEKNFSWAQVLNQITLTTTRGIWLRSLSVEETAIQIVPKAEAVTAEKKDKEAPKNKKEKEKKETPVDKKEAKKKAAADKAAAAKKIRIEKHYALKLEGSCTGSAGQETALIGKYLKALRDDPYFGGLFGTDIDLSGINQRKLGEVDVFDFVIYCRFKKGKM